MGLFKSFMEGFSETAGSIDPDRAAERQREITRKYRTEQTQKEGLTSGQMEAYVRFEKAMFTSQDKLCDATINVQALMAVLVEDADEDMADEESQQMAADTRKLLDEAREQLEYLYDCAQFLDHVPHLKGVHTSLLNGIVAQNCLLDAVFKRPKQRELGGADAIPEKLQPKAQAPSKPAGKPLESLLWHKSFLDEHKRSIEIRLNEMRNRGVRLGYDGMKNNHWEISQSVRKGLDVLISMQIPNKAYNNAWDDIDRDFTQFFSDSLEEATQLAKTQGYGAD